jgi:chromate transporter
LDDTEAAIRGIERVDSQCLYAEGVFHIRWTARIVAFVDGVTAAAVGAIAGACFVLGRRTIFTNGWTPDIVKLVLLLVTVGLLLRFKKLQEPFIVLGAAIVGLVIYPFVHP